MESTPVHVPVPVISYSPLVTISKYAEITGVTDDTVTQWVKRGYIPVHKIGRRVLVNVAAIQKSASMASW